MCTLSAWGRTFDPDAFLKSSTLAAHNVWHKGQPRWSSQPKGPRLRASGFNVGVSNRTWRHLRHQSADATKFLVDHRRELRRLARAPGIEEVCLRLALEIDRKHAFTPTDSLDLPLLAAASAARVTISITLYPVDLEELARERREKRRKASKAVKPARSAAPRG